MSESNADHIITVLREGHDDLDAAAQLRPTAVEILVDRMSEGLAFLGHAEAIDGSAMVGLHTTEPDCELILTVTDGVDLADLDATMWLPAEAWLRLLTGRLDAGPQPATVVIESDGVTLDDLCRVFPGF